MQLFIDNNNTPPFVLYVDGGEEAHYSQSIWRTLSNRFTGNHSWIKAFESQGKTVGFLGATFQERQQKGFLLQPVITDDCLLYLPAMIQKVAAWLEESGKISMIVEIPEHRKQICEYLQNNGWIKQHTWLELVKWLDDRARQKYDHSN